MTDIGNMPTTAVHTRTWMYSTLPKTTFCISRAFNGFLFELITVALPLGRLEAKVEIKHETPRFRYCTYSSYPRNLAYATLIIIL